MIKCIQTLVLLRRHIHTHTHTKDNNLQVNLKRIANEVLTCERQPLQEGRHHGDEDANHQVVLE